MSTISCFIFFISNKLLPRVERGRLYKELSMSPRPYLEDPESDWEGKPVDPIAFAGFSIHSLPTELLSMIFAHLSEFPDFLVFALTSEKLFRIAERTIHTVIHHPGPWAGHRLICAGDYLKTEDIPKGILDKYMRRKVKPCAEEGDWYSKGPTLYNYAHQRFPWAEIPRPIDLIDFMDKRRHEYRTLISSQIMQEIFDWLGYDPKESRRKEKPPQREKERLVLRNFTKKQYVLEDGKYPLGTALLARICYSSSESCISCEACDEWDIFDEIELTRGTWAGDRFDVISADDFFLKAGEIAPVGWTDVSEEALEVVKLIYRCGYDHRGYEEEETEGYYNNSDSD